MHRNTRKRTETVGGAQRRREAHRDRERRTDRCTETHGGAHRYRGEQQRRTVTEALTQKGIVRVATSPGVMGRKCGDEFRGTQNQERLCWRGLAAITPPVPRPSFESRAALLPHVARAFGRIDLRCRPVYRRIALEFCLYPSDCSADLICKLHCVLARHSHFRPCTSPCVLEVCPQMLLTYCMGTSDCLCYSPILISQRTRLTVPLIFGADAHVTARGLCPVGTQ